MPLIPTRTARGSLAWMSSQENETKFKGGILADEMGMGKTIQTIACMMKNRATGPDIGLPSKGQRTKSTLIICPQVAMVQWRGEIERYCAAGSMTLTMYHGRKRIADAGMFRLCVSPLGLQGVSPRCACTCDIFGAKRGMRCPFSDSCLCLPDLLAQYDVVLTTYAIVQTEYSAKFREAKESCPYCRL